jgi:hypothetical protein
MDRSSAYVHALNGRLRIKIAELKGNPLKAQEIEDHFTLMTGMQQVCANPVTGSLLFIYDPHLLKQNEIFTELREWGYLRDQSGRPLSFSNSTPGAHAFVEKITTTLASGLMEVALTRLVSALI